MNICLVNSYYPPWVGGAESYVKNLANALTYRGHEVTVYCSEKPLKAGINFDDKIKVVRMHTPLLIYGTPLVLFPPSIIVEDFHIIHANFPSPYLASVSSFAGEVARTPSVLTWHNDLPPVTSGAGLLVKVHNSIAPAYLRNFDRIIATTPAYAKSSEILRRFSSKVSVVMNGVDTKRFSPEVRGDRIRNMYNLEGCKIVLFVGALTTFHSYKGVDVLIRAFSSVSKKFRDSRLVVVGAGNMLSSFKKLASGLGVSEAVVFPGYVDDNLLPEFYAACDVSVLPSKNSSEGFGLVLIEAMACGKAVIGSRTGGIVDVIKDGKNGILVEPGDQLELASAIAYLFENPDKRVTMGNAGREFAELLDWSKTAERVEAIYNQVQPRR
ncbi:MAG: glycosyltransferase family 4 protein [Thaumarchaeota archaeon]|nr:glycosyltransferase family 4 protein [Nitrososphaerota archaeon]